MSKPVLGTKERAAYDKANKPRRAVRADISWDAAPCISLWTEDGIEYRYALTPSEAAAFIKRTAGYLQSLLKGAAQ